jgi:IPT/TIG domain-containing protein
MAFILFMGMCAALAAAQQPPKPHVTPAPWLIILPPKIVAGAEATLAVLDSQGRLLPRIAVELPDGQKVTTGATGRAMFKAPNQAGRMIANISSHRIHASATVVALEGAASQATPQGGSRVAAVLSYPHVVALHDRFTLEGSGFRGAADSNHVYLNGDPCLIVASSSVSMVALPGPSVPVGDVTLHVTVAGTEAGQFPISAVQLEFSGPEEAVNAGATGELTLRARGTTEPLVLEVRNGSPGVIQLSKGNVQRVKTSGGDENIAPVEVKFVTDGNYSVSARLVYVDSRRTQEHAQ